MIVLCCGVRCAELDIVPAVVTFGACLASRLEVGIVVGIAVNLAFLLYASARPAVKATRAVVSHLCLKANIFTPTNLKSDWKP